jgi:hypothetical protein
MLIFVLHTYIFLRSYLGHLFLDQGSEDGHYGPPSSRSRRRGDNDEYQPSRKKSRDGKRIE